jgi:1,4-dihydroxy-2-naphthoate octaprenyltransferase
VRLGRPLFLIGGFLFHALGVLMALYTGASVSVPTLLWGQVAITSIQLMTHYSNDYFDLKADQANLTPTQWSGGSRILVDGLLSPQVALATAVFLAVLASGAALLLGIVLQPGILTLSLLFLALLTAWSYSSPPLRLHSRGVGELTTALLVPGLTPLLGFYLHAGTLPLLPFPGDFSPVLFPV